MRMVVLAAVAGVPVVVMASLVVWQNYQLASESAPKQVMLLRAEALAHADAIVADGEAVLQDAALALVAGADCRAVMSHLRAAHAAELTFIGVLGGDGTDCGGLPPTLHPLFAPFVLEPNDPGTLLVAAVSQGRRTMLAGFTRDRFARVRWTDLGVGGSVWLTDGRHVVPVAGQDPDATPSDALVAALVDGGGVLQDIARNGRPYVYAGSRISGNLGLVAGYGAARAQALARRLLVHRVVELAALLLAGLGALVLGADTAVVGPLRRLGRAVGGWRITGRLEPPDAHDLPSEIRDLWDSFSRATATLGQREAELKRAVTAQDLAMKEIHHRVKNNLQIVASLLNLQASRIHQPEARAEFQSARDRVRALATLHRHLYADGELHTINMRSFLTELCDQLFQAMGEKAGGRIALCIDAPELRMLSDQAVPLALIVTEAVSNAVKYAFPGGRHGSVAVTLSERDGEATLVVQDDGVGIPAGRAETETGTRDGIGLQLIRGFARQLGGTLDVREGDGTRYELRMRLHRERAAEPA